MTWPRMVAAVDCASAGAAQSSRPVARAAASSERWRGRCRWGCVLMSIVSGGQSWHGARTGAQAGSAVDALRHDGSGAVPCTGPSPDCISSRSALAPSLAISTRIPVSTRCTKPDPAGWPKSLRRFLRAALCGGAPSMLSSTPARHTDRHRPGSASCSESSGDHDAAGDPPAPVRNDRGQGPHQQPVRRAGVTREMPARLPRPSQYPAPSRPSSAYQCPAPPGNRPHPIRNPREPSRSAGWTIPLSLPVPEPRFDAGKQRRVAPPPRGPPRPHATAPKAEAVAPGRSGLEHCPRQPPPGAPRPPGAVACVFKFGGRRGATRDPSRSDTRAAAPDTHVPASRCRSKASGHGHGIPSAAAADLHPADARVISGF